MAFGTTRAHGIRARVYPFSAFGNDVANVPTGALVNALPEYTTLPTPDSSWLGKSVLSNGEEFTCRYVAELNGPDTIYCNIQNTTINKANSQLSFVFRDVSAGISALTTFGFLYNVTTDRARFFADATTGYVRLQLRQTDGSTIFGTVSGPNINICDGNFHKITISFVNEIATLFVDGIAGTPLSLTGWTSTDATQWRFSDVALTIRPFDILKYSLVLNGEKVDCIKMDEASGLTLANGCNPSNPATISDAAPTNPHAIVWVPNSVSGDPVSYSLAVVKQARYVVELNGPDTLSLPILATDLRFVPWEIEWTCNDSSATQSATNRLIQIMNNGTGNTTSALVYKTTQTNIQLEFRSGAAVGLFAVVGTVPSTGFFKVKIKKNGTTSGTCQLYVNGVLQGTSVTIDYSLWTDADKISSISMLDSSVDLRPYQVLNYRSVLNGALRDCVAMTEDSGLTLANQCDPARPATITDASPTGPHAKTLVPVSVL